MKDLIEIAHLARLNGGSDEDVNRKLAEAVYEELKRMKRDEFISHFAFVSATPKSKKYEVRLEFDI